MYRSNCSKNSCSIWTTWALLESWRSRRRRREIER